MRGFFLLNNLLIAKYRYLTMKIKYPSLSCPSYHGVFFFFFSEHEDSDWGNLLDTIRTVYI